MFQGIKDKVAQYIDVRVSLIKLGFIERTSNVLSLLIYILFILLVGFLILIFFGFGLSAFFTDLFDSEIKGMFATMGVFIVLLITFMVLGRFLKRIFTNLFIDILTTKKDEKKDNE